MGQITKKFVLFGSNRTLPDGKIVALNGEAGDQADTLASGLYWFYWPWQYTIKVDDLTHIEKGFVGCVIARDGIPIVDGRVLGKCVPCDAFQDARKFLDNGGERGPQLFCIPPGDWRINKALFTVVPEKACYISPNKVGLITTLDGKALPEGEIAGKVIPGHNEFQDGQKFMDNGGYRGPQEQVVLSGLRYINPWFATYKEVDLTEVEMAHVGVVVSFVGDLGEDVTGEEFKHGNLVKRGFRGVWVDSYDPGKYPINPLTHRVEQVSTANIVLNWATGKTEAHNLDKNLSTIVVRSLDGFKFPLDVSQIIHIPRADAPKVIARFGSVANLVTQVLEPTIGNYFRNAAQGSEALEFLNNRAARQLDARIKIGEALKEYNVVAVDTLIGDIVPPDQLMETLQNRKIAEQQKITFETQKEAQEVRKELAQAQAIADTQANVVASQRKVEIAKFDSDAVIKKAAGDAESKTINAKADAEVLEVVGKATANNKLAVGTAEAEVIKLKTAAVGQNNYAVIEVGRALAENKIKLVPEIFAGGGNGQGGGTLVDVLVANMIRDKLHTDEVAKQVETITE